MAASASHPALAPVKHHHPNELRALLSEAKLCAFKHQLTRGAQLLHLLSCHVTLILSSNARVSRKHHRQHHYFSVVTLDESSVAAPRAMHPI